MSSLEKCLFRFSALYVFLFLIGWLVSLLLSCMSSFYILETKTFSFALFANIFSHSIGCLFIWFMVSFSVQKLLSLFMSHLSIFAHRHLRSSLLF